MIKFKKINSKKVVAVMLTCFVLVQTGCNSKTQEIKQNEMLSTNNLDNSIDDLNESKENLTQNQKDDYANDYFNKASNKIDEIIESESVQNVKDKTKKIFINLIDFIFYDGSINGISFDGLSSDTKTKLMDMTLTIDSKIEKVNPGYKKTIKDKSGKAITYVKEKLEIESNKVENKIKEKVGEEKYNKTIDEIKSKASKTKEKTKNTYDRSKQKVKNWYENWRNK